MTRFQKLAAVDRSRRRSCSSRSGSSSAPRTRGSAARTGRSATASCCRRSTTPRPGSSGSTGRSRRSSASRSSVWRSSRSSTTATAGRCSWPSIAAVALVGFQAWLGRETVRLGNSGESVTAHLAAAMLLVGAARVRDGPRRLPGPPRSGGGSQRFTLLAAFTALGHVRPAAVRLARDRHDRGARLPGLAADERHVRSRR